MHHRSAAWTLLIAATALTGCATTRARHASEADSAAQIAALQSKQMVQLQQTMSMSAKAEGAYMAQKAEQEAAAREREKRFWQDATPEKYVEGKGKPQRPHWDK